MKNLTSAALLALAILAVTAVAPAQDTGGSRYAVTYVEVAPASVPPAVAAFTRYRDASRREAGFVAAELVEQIGRAGHFVVVETWADQAAFDAHQAAASLAQFKDALQPVRLSGYDQRPYKALSVAAPRGTPGRDAVEVVAHVDIGGGPPLDTPAVLRQLADASRAEPGCLRFDVLQHAVRGNHFTVIERWENQGALERHAAAAHTRRYRDEVQPSTGSPIDERVFRILQ
jgi:quinol monooxygenase YgiN